MSSYISARFEKTSIPSVPTTRIITRNRDDGTVPPSPSAIYFPTHPDDVRNFILSEWISNSLGEQFLNVASLSDLSTYAYKPLTQVNDTSGNLTLAQVGDLFEIFLPDPAIWTSEEYPGVNFVFAVDSLIDANNITVTPELPSYLFDFSWEIRRLTGVIYTTITQGVNGMTRRPGVNYGAPPQKFLEKRFNSYFTSEVQALDFVEATKTEMTGLANELLSAGLSNENYTASPTI